MALITTTKIKQLPVGNKQIAHGGVTGLVYMPSKSRKGRGSWRLRYQSPTDKKPVILTIGNYPAMSIADAALKGGELQNMIDSGRDPRLEMRQEKQRQQHAQLTTFEHVAKDFIENKLTTGAWRSQKYGKKALSRLEKHVFPSIGTYPVDSIKSQDIQKCLSAVWHSKQDTANKLIMYISQIFDWAESKDLCGHNPVKAAKTGLGKQAVNKSPDEKHMPSMPWQTIPAFVADVLLAGKPTQAKYALLFQILNAARPGAVLLMEFSEVDFDKAVWTMPALSHGRKTDVDRFYPLSTQALDLLRFQRQDTESSLVFPSPSKRGKSLSDMTLTKIMKERADTLSSDIAGRYPVSHGFRSSFRNWASEQGHDDKWAEVQLAHAVGNKVQQAYDRTPLTEQRRAMMQEWSDFCFSQIHNFHFGSDEGENKENGKTAIAIALCSEDAAA